jgi:hypothetical protein
MDRFSEQSAADLARNYAAFVNAGFDSPAGCENCGTTRGFIDECWTDDGRKPMLCEDCTSEVRRMEVLADELAAKPSCEARQALIDKAQSTEQLVNVLRGHDQIECFACLSTRETAVTDRLFVDAAAICCAGKAA